MRHTVLNKHLQIRVSESRILSLRKVNGAAARQEAGMSLGPGGWTVLKAVTLPGGTALTVTQVLAPASRSRLRCSSTASFVPQHPQGAVSPAHKNWGQERGGARWAQGQAE